MNNPIEHTILQWKSKQRADAPPFRYEFDHLNEDIQFLLGFGEDSNYKIKCSGLFFDGLIGSSVVGRTLSSLFETESQARVKACIDRVFTGPSIVRLTLQPAGSHNEDPIEIVLLPVRAEHGPVEFAIGAIDINEMPQFSSPKMSLLHTNIKELRDAPTNHVVGFAEEKSSFSHKPKSPFTVINGDKNAKGITKSSHFKIIQNVKREP